MADPSLTQTLLALFVTAEKAEEIEGDLLEQAVSRGRAWHVLQVLQTVVALFFHALVQEPGKILLLAYAVYELAIKLNWWLLRPLRFWLWKEFDLALWQAIVINDFILILTGFSIGMTLVRIFPKAGAQVAMIAAGLILVRVILLGGDVLHPPEELALFGLLPLMLGAFAMKRLELKQSARLTVA